MACGCDIKSGKSTAILCVLHTPSNVLLVEIIILFISVQASVNTYFKHSSLTFAFSRL